MFFSPNHLLWRLEKAARLIQRVLISNPLNKRLTFHAIPTAFPWGLNWVDKNDWKNSNGKQILDYLKKGLDLELQQVAQRQAASVHRPLVVVQPARLEPKTMLHKGSIFKSCFEKQGAMRPCLKLQLQLFTATDSLSQKGCSIYVCLPLINFAG